MDRPGGRSDSEQVEGEDAPAPRILRDPGVPDAGRDARWAAWQAENAEAIEDSNAWVAKHGLPLAKYRLF